MAPHIRDAELSDAPAMARIIVDTWFAAHRGQVDPAVFAEREKNWGYADSEAGWRRTIATLTANDKVLLAIDDDDRVIGVGASSRIDPTTAEIYVLYVDVTQHRFGIGRRLAEAIMAFHRERGAATMLIAVLTANLPARRFYERIGGHVVGERPQEEGNETVYAWSLRQEG